MKKVFLLDSNVLISSKDEDYPFKLFPGFWELIEKGIQEEIIKIHQMVKDELVDKNVDGKEDELSLWIKGLDDFCFVGQNDDDSELLTELANWAKNERGLPQESLQAFFENGVADPWICASAKSNNYILVTQEVSALRSKRIKIPDACERIGAQYCNKCKMLEDLNAVFELSKNHKF